MRISHDKYLLHSTRHIQFMKSPGDNRYFDLYMIKFISVLNANHNVTLRWCVCNIVIYNRLCCQLQVSHALLG